MASPSLAPEAPSSPPPPAGSVRPHLTLFLATVVAVFVTGFVNEPGPPSWTKLAHAAQFTGALLGILVAHELGHYVAARIHGVDASLPYFIPLPVLSPFGTMGAVIRMRGVIPTRRALLDIGASGPLAGLAVAIPLYAYGIAHSRVVPTEATEGGLMLGESLLTRLLEHLAAPPVPEGMTLYLSPVGFAAWGGLLLTMLNLLPVSQLDGGHVAYALFGPRQNDYARLVHRGLLAFFLVSVTAYLVRDVRAGFGLLHMGRAISRSFFWLMWFEVLGVLGTIASRGEGKRDPADMPIAARIVGIFGLAYWPPSPCSSPWSAGAARCDAHPCLITRPPARPRWTARGERWPSSPWRSSSRCSCPPPSRCSAAQRRADTQELLRKIRGGAAAEKGEHVPRHALTCVRNRQRRRAVKSHSSYGG